MNFVQTVISKIVDSSELMYDQDIDKNIPYIKLEKVTEILEETEIEFLNKHSEETVY